MMTPAQSRAARALLDRPQQHFADAAGNAAVRDFERGTSSRHKATLDVLQRALETAGVELIPENGSGPGVRWANRAEG